MKKKILILILGILVVGINTACYKFGATSEAFEAYKVHAEPITLEEYKKERQIAMNRYGAPRTVPHIMNIEYELSSGESAGDGQYSLTVAEVIRFEHPDSEGRPGRVYRHDVLMQKDDEGNWEVVEVEKKKITWDRRKTVRPKF